MRTNKLILLLTLSLMVFANTQNCQSQSIKRQCIGSYGMGNTVQGLFVNQTIGQPFFTSSFKDDLIGLSPGFQQPFNFTLQTAKQPSWQTGLDIFPNPAKNYFNISMPDIVDNAIIEIIDVRGRMIRNEKISKFQYDRMDCTKWQSGLYFVTVNDKDKNYSYTSKVIIF